MTDAITIAMMQVGSTFPGYKMFWLWLGFLASMVVGAMCVSCHAPGIMHKSPQNYIIWLLVTLAESIMVGLISVLYRTASVALAFGILTVVVFALIAFACQTKIEFTGRGPYIFVALLCLMAFVFFIWIGSYFLPAESMQTLRLVCACGGALLFSFHIVNDTQLIVGGNHGWQFSIDDYAHAAIALHPVFKCHLGLGTLLWFLFWLGALVALCYCLVALGFCAIDPECLSRFF